jgi:hypothetical protein
MGEMSLRKRPKIRKEQNELPVDSAVSGGKVAERCLIEWLERDSETKRNRERKWVWVGKM